MPDSKWKQNLRPASFRGVSFGVTSVEGGGGRRTVEHEFIAKDAPYIEDLGRKGRDFSVTAFVIGDDYMTQRDDLLDALETKGPATLIHPYKGEITVQVVDFKYTETFSSGGMATFSITFKETEPVKYPVDALNKSENVNIKADNVDKSLTDSLVEGFNTLSMYTKNCKAGLESARVAINSALVPLVAGTDAADSFANDIYAMQVESDLMMSDPARMANSLITTLSRYSSIAASPGLATKVYYNLSKKFAEIFGLTFSSTIETNNMKLMKHAYMIASAGAASRVSASQDFITYNEAETAKSQMYEIIESVTNETENDALYSAAIDLKITINQAVPREGVTLKNIAQVEMKTTMPAFLLSYILYGNLEHEQEIIDRNNIRDPGFIYGWQTVEVLV